MREIRYHPKVPGETRKIVRYYEEISGRLADEFWDELLSAISHAAEFPDRHHFDASGRRRANLKKFPYHFLFRVFDLSIRVTVVRHDRRSEKFGARRG